MTKDLLHSIRSLIRHPAFTAVAVITLMLAIGVNTTIFSVVNAVLLKALPFRDPQQLVSVAQAPGDGGLPGIAAYQYLAWKDRNTSFDDLAAFTDNNFNLTGIGEPERISCAQVTANLFTTLGELALGMTIGSSLGILAGLLLGRMPLAAIILRDN